MNALKTLKTSVMHLITMLKGWTSIQNSYIRKGTEERKGREEREDGDGKGRGDWLPPLCGAKLPLDVYPRWL